MFVYKCIIWSSHSTKITLQAICSILLVTGLNMTEILIRVSSGKRPGVEKIPEDKPPECEDMIGVMQQCWHQDCTRRPAFSGNEPHFCPCFCLMKTIIVLDYMQTKKSQQTFTQFSYSSEITMSKEPTLLHLLSASQFLCDCFFLRSPSVKVLIQLFDLVTAIFNIHCLCLSIKVVE